jgi:hypothetical protein
MHHTEKSVFFNAAISVFTGLNYDEQKMCLRSVVRVDVCRDTTPGIRKAW